METRLNMLPMNISEGQKKKKKCRIELIRHIAKSTEHGEIVWEFFRPTEIPHRGVILNNLEI